MSVWFRRLIASFIMLILAGASGALCWFALDTLGPGVAGLLIVLLPLTVLALGLSCFILFCGIDEESSQPIDIIDMESSAISTAISYQNGSTSDLAQVKIN